MASEFIMTPELIIQLLILGLMIVLSIAITIIFIRVSNQQLSAEAQHKLIASDILSMRKKELFRLASRIRTGQSSAIVGLFSEEKSEILRYLNNQDPQQRQQLYREKADALIFSYVNMAMDLSENDTPAKFWETALSGIYRTVRIDSEIAQTYRFCVDTQFQKAELEDFLMALQRDGKQLVLLLDRFERLLDYSEFKNNWEFFTTLRRFATSQSPSLLTLVIASNLSLPRLHEEIQQNQKTSPVLNFIEVTPVVGLSETEVDRLLREEAPRLSEVQRKFVLNMSGGHPYLMKVVVTILLEEQGGSLERTEEVICSRVKDSLKNAIRSWSPTTCQVLQRIRQQDEVSGFEKELNELKDQGIIIKKSGNWLIHAQLFERCLTDADIIKNVEQDGKIDYDA